MSKKNQLSGETCAINLMIIFEKLLGYMCSYKWIAKFERRTITPHYWQTIDKNIRF